MKLSKLPALLGVFTILFFTGTAFANENGPAREVIEETVNKMVTLSQQGNHKAWASHFSEDAVFKNSALSEAVVGRTAIVEMAGEWSSVENEIEWRVIEGLRMVIGWRERGVLEDGRRSGWYSGVSTFVFNANGQVKEYEGVFNVADVKKAYAFAVTIEEDSGVDTITEIEVAETASEHMTFAPAPLYLPDDSNVIYQWYTPADELPRFQPYDLNYAIWQETEGDDPSLEGHYSFKYTVYDCRRKRAQGSNPISDLSCKEGAYLQPQVFLSYTGEFDFYMETRDSSPVINRMNNPALHIRTLINYKLENRSKNSPNIRFVDVALEHRSNGQDRDVDERIGGRLLTDIAYQTGNDSFFDSISRGADYMSFTVGSMNGAANAYNYEVGAKAYFGHESQVNWGELADENVSILDYDILRFGFSKRFSKTGIPWMPEITLATEYNVGWQGFDTDSGEITLVAPVKMFDSAISIPLFAKAHFGPMDSLSNYTNSVNSFGVGLALWY